MLKLKFLDSLLIVNPENRNWIDIIIWWEIHRVLYNLIVLVAGIISLVIMLTAMRGHVHVEPGEDLFEPIMIVAFAVMCNLCYTLGWFTEIFITPSATYSRRMFKFGLKFTLFFVFLPSAFWVIKAILMEIGKLF